MKPGLFSYLFPRTIETTSSEHNTCLEVVAMNGKMMLNSATVNYSFGPLDEVWRSAFDQIKLTERKWTQLLVLGLGSGNIPSILNEKKNDFQITGVEIDPVVIRLGKQYFDLDKHPNLNVVIADAEQYLSDSRDKVDVICVDLFIDSKMPVFTEDLAFIHQCLDHLHSGGALLLNRLMHEPALARRSETFTEKVKTEFPEVKVLTCGANRILWFRQS